MKPPPGYQGFLPLLKGENAQELMDAAKVVKAAMETPGWERVADLIRQRREKLTTMLVHTGVMDEAKTQQAIGMISGLEQAELAPAALLYAAEEAEREAQRIAEAVASGEETSNG